MRFKPGEDGMGRALSNGNGLDLNPGCQMINVEHCQLRIDIIND